MTIDEIRKNAPVGANMYAMLYGKIYYFTKVGNRVYWASGMPFTLESVTNLKPL